MEKKNQWNTGYWIVALLLLLSLQSYWQTAKTVEPVPYSEFEKALDEGRVAEVLVSDRTVTGRLKSPDSRGKTTIVATRVEPDLADRLSKYDVPYACVLESTWLSDVLSWILPAVSFFGVWFFLFRRFAEKQGMGGFLNIGKSRAKVFVEKNTGVTFADVAGGGDEAKAELVAIVDFLKNPQDYGRLGARIPKGVLLVGPPGPARHCWPRLLPGGRIDPGAHRSGYPRHRDGRVRARLSDSRHQPRGAGALCARAAGAGNARRKRYPSIDSRTCSELKTVVGAIQSKPTALFSASSNSSALFKENRYVCIDSVGPLPGTG